MEHAELPTQRSASPRREDRRQYELHRAVVAKLRTDPDTVLGRAAAGIGRLTATLNPGALPWVAEWANAIDSGPSAVEQLCLLDTPHGASLRQVSPFFGVLTEDERLAALRRA